MEVSSRIFDNRINSLNVLLEITLGNYFELSKDIIDNNELQRRRVKASSSVYSLLKTDLRTGCVIPPIVLALAIDATTTKETKNDDLVELIQNNKNRLIILDGLQRTYTIRDLINEITATSDPDIESILKSKIRMEVYIGINKLGILYRMLTLNAGQTPMSSRHQIEIIYSDYLKEPVDDIRILKEVDDFAPSKLGEYRFRDIIEGFTSYLERDYLTIDRTDILDNIRSLEKLSIENQSDDLFKDFLSAYHKMVVKMKDMSNDWKLSDEDVKTVGPAFAKNALSIFNKSQVMTGFGSALGKLIDFDAIKSIGEVTDKITLIKSDNIETDLNEIIINLDKIRNVAKKIGNDQRMYFHFFFRELLDPKSDGYLDIGRANAEAYTQYERKTK